MIVLYVLLAIALFLVLITVHEAGHYFAGKLLKFKINEFSIGFGKAIFQKTNKKTGEKFSVRIFPLGGYCMFEGEDEENPNPGAFNNQKPWKRLIVLAAGVTCNFLFGVLFAAIFLMVSGYSVPKIEYVLPDSPNATVLQVGDEIEKVNGKNIEIYKDLGSLVKKAKSGEKIDLTIVRDGKHETVTIEKYEHSSGYYIRKAENISKLYIKNGEEFIQLETEQQVLDAINAAEGNFENLFYSEYHLAYTKAEVGDILGLVQTTEGTSLGIVYGYADRNYGFFESLGKAWPFSFKICGLILSSLGGIFTGVTKVSDLGGTVTAIGQVAQLSQQGALMFLYLIPILSLNLAIFNFLPIPALDGSKFLFVLIEWIFRKPIPRKIEAYIHMCGLFLLLGLVLFLDLYHIIA